MTKIKKKKSLYGEIKHVILKNGSERVKLYFYICAVCNKLRQTYYIKKAEAGVCSICRNSEAVKNQLSLFPKEEVAT